MLKLSDCLRIGIFGCVLAALFPVGAEAKFKIFHSFAGGFDGSDPESDLFIDGNGVLYGTTRAGGIGGNMGTLFKIPPGGKEKVLHAFTGGASDGAQPVGGIILDKRGNIYGSTYGGGANGLGVVYRFGPDGVETLLHTFQGICCGADGSFPIGNLVFGARGNMYGVTQKGGGPTDLGSVFEANTDGTETVIHGFTGTADGEEPYGGLMIDGGGSLYGITLFGGSADECGTVYKITPQNVESVLHAFAHNSSDGCFPHGSLALDKDGNVYGSTLKGGAQDLGSVYIITAAGIETVVHSFNGADGAQPACSLIRDKKGNLYGTTFSGGTNNMGTAFELKTSGELKVLHSFNGSDGKGPVGGVVADADGNLYGTTAQGGANNLGVVFEITVKKKTTE